MPVKTVVVTGGRDFDDRAFVFDSLDEVKRNCPDWEYLVHGAARGVDLMAAEWAYMHGVQQYAVPADWKMEGRAAGSNRNQRMLNDYRPDCVVAFPGGRGTADCVRRAMAMGIPVLEMKP